jgi:hypothetical protein
MPDSSVPRNVPPETGRTRAQPLPAGVVPPELSLRRSRVGWQVPVFGMPVLLAVSAVLAGTKVTPPGIGVIAFFWGLAQTIWLGGPAITSRRQLPEVNRQRMLITGRSWTGHRTLDLAKLSRVRRVKWTFSSEYGGSKRVDYIILTDRARVRLSIPRWAAAEPVELALAYQRQHGMPQAQVSRFAAIGLALAPGDARFRIARFLIVKAIPALAGYHGG